MKKIGIQKNLQEALIIFVVVLTAYGYFSWGMDWNINSRLALVKSFVEEGQFEIDSYIVNELGTNDKAFINGHYYSDKAIGSSVLGVIVYYPIHWLYSVSSTSLSTQAFCDLLTFLVISLPAALIAPFAYLLVKQITNNPMKALVITLGISLGTPLFKYSTAYYGHSLAATAYFFAFLVWFNARRQKTISLQQAFISSILLGFMLITEYPTALLLALLLPYILYTLYQSGHLFTWKTYGVMALGFIIPVCMLLYYNNSIFGSPFATGYSFESSQAYQAAHEESIMGIGQPSIFNFWYQTFQPAFGIFWQSPILFLALPSWTFMVISKEYRAEAIFCFAAIFSYVVIFSGYYMWWGGLAFTPRHLIPILPIFVLPLAFIPEMLLIPLGLGAAVSIFQNLVLTASGFEGLGTYLSEYLRPIWKKHGILQPRGMLIYDVCLPNILNGDLENNRGIDLFGLKSLSSLLPLLFFELTLTLAFIKLAFLKKTLPESVKH